MDYRKKQQKLDMELQKLDMQLLRAEEEMQDRAPPSEWKWEQRLGKNTTERTKRLGNESEEYRRLLRLGDVDKLVMYAHNFYIHKIGADLLQTQIDFKKEKELQHEAILRKTQKVGKLLRRKIKVTDLDDGGVAISIDREWDTSTWTDELIEAGCEALMLIFFNMENNSSEERKDRAVQMLQKLLYRHPAAQEYVRKNIEVMVGKTATKLIMKGKSAGVLDILYILHSCRESYTKELSLNNFNGKGMSMLIQEARLAAIIIQHTFRAKLSRMSSVVIQPLQEGFGSDVEFKISKIALINARSTELRRRWRLMHSYYSRSFVRQPGGLRGPITIASKYVILTLDIMIHLVSAKVGHYAHGNREDIVRSGGSVILSTYLSYPKSPFAYVTAALLAQISRVPESFKEIIHAGGLASCLKLLRYLRLLGIGTFDYKEKKTERYSPLTAYLQTIDIVTYTSYHASGLYRAAHGYGFMKAARGEVERIDYLFRLNEYQAQSKNYDCEADTCRFLGNYHLLRELSTMVLQAQSSAVILSRILICFLSLACSYANHMVNMEVNSLSGVVMIRLLDVLQINESNLGLQALCLYLQLCTTARGRLQLIGSQVQKYLAPCTNADLDHKDNAQLGIIADYRKHMRTNYARPHYERSILLACALCRQYNWRFYDPQELPEEVSSGTIRQLIYLDLLKTMKTPDLNRADEYSISDLVILPTDTGNTLAMSKQMHSIAFSKDITDFICHPDDSNHYEALPLHEAAASCVILEGISAHVESASAMYTPGVVNFISKFIFLCKYLFLGKPMKDEVIMILFNGLLSGNIALARIAHSLCFDLERIESFVHVTQASEMITSICFFMNTLSVSHPKLEESTRELQIHVGLSALKFFNAFSTMLLSIDGKSKLASFTELTTPAHAVINLITQLKVVHGKSPAMLVIFDQMCDFLYKNTIHRRGAYVAVHEWNIYYALKIYLPAPLSGMMYSEYSEMSTDYKIGLMDLPASFFELCANLTQIDEGNIHNLNDGFLRRALDKLTILCNQHKYSSNERNYLITSQASPSLVMPSAIRMTESRYETYLNSDNFFDYDHSVPLSMQAMIAETNKSYIQTKSFIDNNTSYWSHGVRLAKEPFDHRFTSSEKRILIASLRLIARSANFHHARCGSTNDLITWHFFSVVEICHNFISDKNFHRKDPLYEICMELLSCLCRDTYRLQRFVESYDVLALIGRELEDVEMMSVKTAANALTILKFSTSAITSKYLVNRIIELRKPTAKVSRIYPELSEQVTDTNWSLTKCVMIYRSSVDPNFTERETSFLEMDEFVRTGTLSPQVGSPMQRTSLVPSSYAQSPTMLQIEQKKASYHSSDYAIAGARPSNPMLDPLTSGSYQYCGVTSCGSLRDSAFPTAHGDFLGKSEAEISNLMLNVIYKSSENKGLYTDIAKLSARDKGLLEEIEHRKAVAGYREMKKVNPKELTFTGSSTHKKVSSRKSNQHGEENTVFPLVKLAQSSPSLSPYVKKDKLSLSSPDKSHSKVNKSLSKQQKATEFRTVLLDDIPELILTRPPKPGV